MHAYHAMHLQNYDLRRINHGSEINRRFASFDRIFSLKMWLQVLKQKYFLISPVKVFRCIGSAYSIVHNLVLPLLEPPLTTLTGAPSLPNAPIKLGLAAAAARFVRVELKGNSLLTEPTSPELDSNAPRTPVISKAF